MNDLHFRIHAIVTRFHAVTPSDLQNNTVFINKLAVYLFTSTPHTTLTPSEGSSQNKQHLNKQSICLPQTSSHVKVIIMGQLKHLYPHQGDDNNNELSLPLTPIPIL